MFSFGWSELALIAVVVIIIIGPKEIPNLLKQIGTFTKSIKKISREFKSSLNEIANDTELKDVKNIERIHTIPLFVTKHILSLGIKAAPIEKHEALLKHWKKI